jgi:predicted amidophosphoribosyltransferase
LIGPKLQETAPPSGVENHVYVFKWSRFDEQVLDQLVYRLKANQSPAALAYYSNFLSEKLKMTIDLRQYAGLVPVPGSSSGRNHAEKIADNLSVSLGLKVFKVLEKLEGAKQQKKLTAGERKTHNPFRLKDNLPEDFTASLSETGNSSIGAQAGNPVSFILVDDVLTTGQSIKHCETRLFPAKRNAVATLFYRPPLRS